MSSEILKSNWQLVLFNLMSKNQCAVYLITGIAGALRYQRSNSEYNAFD